MRFSPGPRNLRRIAVCTAALALTAAACSSSDSSESAPAEPTPTASTADDSPVAAPPATEADGAPSPTTGSSDGTATTIAPAVPEALQFTAPLVGGGEFSGAAVADKPTVFWFWAPT